MPHLQRSLSERQITCGKITAAMKHSAFLLLTTTILAALALEQACSSSSQNNRNDGASLSLGGVGSGGAPETTLTGGSPGVATIDLGQGTGMGVAGIGTCGALMCEDKLPACGDSILDSGEKCDDGNTLSGDGCGPNCDAIDKDFACPTPGKACVSTVTCGDSKITGTESCDDGNAVAGDGCDTQCSLEAGWKCPVVGARCVAAECGDSKVAGAEECDDAKPAGGDGCSVSCTIEPKFKCDVPGQPCVPTTCGDKKVEGTEQCDDGNFDTGDGCSPLCKGEPKCVNGVCEAKCGDGLKLDSEACDDGNQRNFDGCSSLCAIEPGFSCDVTVEAPNLPVVYRDFIGWDENDPVDDTGPRHKDFESSLVTDRCQQTIATTLTAGKPVLLATKNCVSSAATFAQWYRSDDAINRTVLGNIMMSPVPGTPGAFQFEDPTFYPLDGKGFNDPTDLKEHTRDGDDGPHNFSFTSELRYWFTYRGGEKLTFYGDDDVWVFINGHLAVSIPGQHPAEDRWIILGGPAGAGSTGSDISNDPPTTGIFDPVVLGLTPGGVYEVVVFQAERHTDKSGYKLTLQNFLNARSVCKSTCGDGMVASNEACDVGVNDGAYGSCNADCTLGPRCGDGVLQAVAGEACDDGINLTSYSVSTNAAACAPGCKKPNFCGDGVVDSVFGEACDDTKNAGGYGKCAPECHPGEFCGDGKVNGTEQCDDGNKVGNDGCTAACTTGLR